MIRRFDEQRIVEFVYWVRACYYPWILVAIVWSATAFVSKRTSRREGVTVGVGYRVLTLVGGFLLFDSRLSVSVLGARFVPASMLAGITGFLLTVAGIAFALWARFFIGRNWSATVTVKEDHKLIRGGPYAIVRHPIYSGFTLAALGTAIAVGEVRALIAVILIAAAWRVKWGLEETFMTEEFGEEYLDYKRHVRALIPGIW